MNASNRHARSDLELEPVESPPSTMNASYNVVLLQIFIYSFIL